MKKHLEDARKYLNSVDPDPEGDVRTNLNELRRAVNSILTHLETPEETPICAYCEMETPHHTESCPFA